MNSNYLYGLIPFAIGGILWLLFGVLAKDCKHVLTPGESKCMRCGKDLT